MRRGQQAAQVVCYSFGAPRCGNHAFARDYNHLVPDTWSIINDQARALQYPLLGLAFVLLEIGQRLPVVIHVISCKALLDANTRASEHCRCSAYLNGPPVIASKLWCVTSCLRHTHVLLLLCSSLPVGM